MKSEKTKKAFIETAYRISKDEGKANVTLRRLARELNVNSACLYQYFEDIDELFLYAGMKYLKEYLEAIERFFQIREYNSREVVLGTWRIFTEYSFRNPRMYNSIFFNKHQRKMKFIMEDYYYLFPEEVTEIPEYIREVFLNGNLEERNLIIFQSCAKDGFISAEEAQIMNLTFLQIYKGYLKDFLDGRRQSVDVDDVSHAVEEINHLYTYLFPDAKQMGN